MSTSPPPLTLRPRTDASAVNDTSDLLNIPPNQCGKKFIYAHSPSSWIFMDDVGFVPSLDMIPGVPGANGVLTNGDMSGAVAQTAQNGSTVIQPHDARLGDYAGYCVWFPTLGGTKHYVNKWQRPAILPDRTVVWNTAEASKIHREFLTHLRDSGICGAMHEAVYLREIEKQNERINSLTSRCGINPALKPRLEAAIKRLEAMEQSWTKMQDARQSAASPLGMGRTDG